MDTFIRIISGKRAGEIAKFISEEGIWVNVETSDIGVTNYPKNCVVPIDSSKVVDRYVPYFGKKCWAGWEIPDEGQEQREGQVPTVLSD